MFRFRPRIRFNGVYISTVNYIRPGQAAPSQTTWGSPVHIVTYYRYLRFFRNGAVLSLLTTHEPAEVVHALLPSRFHIKAPASSPVFNVLKGRWKLGREAEKEGAIGLDESALTVETEGVDPKYVYRMELELKGQERGRARLMWKGFWNWNRLTDDWGEFGLRNDKAFVFSRVKAYGMGA
jgi:F-box protein 9